MKNRGKVSRKFIFLIIIIILVTVIGLFVVEDDNALYNLVVAPIVIDDSNAVTGITKRGVNIPFDNDEEIENSPLHIDELQTIEVKTPLADTGESEIVIPIYIEDKEIKFKDDSDYDTSEITITDAYYFVEVDGKKVKKKIENTEGCTIYIQKKGSTVKDKDEAAPTPNGLKDKRWR